MTKNVAVVGCGYWGKNLVRNMNELGALAAVVDATVQGQALAAQIAPGTPVFSQIDGVLQNSDI